MAVAALETEALRSRVRLIHHHDRQAQLARDDFAEFVALLIGEGITYREIVAALDDCEPPVSLRPQKSVGWTTQRLETMVRRWRTRLGLPRPGSGRRARVQP